jgi:hypothetical protein
MSRVHSGGFGVVCAVAGVLLAACGGGPATPTTPTPEPSAQFPVGPAVMDIGSMDDTCSPKTQAWGLQWPHTFSSVTIATEGNEWVARSDNPRYGDIEIRFTLTKGAPGQANIAGRVRGTAVDILSILSFPNPSRVAVSGAGGTDAVVTGSYLTQLTGATGTLSGTLVYTDFLGGVMTCTSGTWALFARRL